MRLLPRIGWHAEDEIQKELNVLIGKTIVVRVNGTFEADRRKVKPLSWAYEFISMFKRSAKKKSSMIVEQMVYRVKSPFTNRVAVTLSEDGKKVEIVLSTLARGVIRQNYLESLLQHLELDYCLCVLGVMPDVIPDQG